MSTHRVLGTYKIITQACEDCRAMLKQFEAWHQVDGKLYHADCCPICKTEAT